MTNDFLSRAQYEPAVLFVDGKGKSLSRAVVNYPWNLIVTTDCDINFSLQFNNDSRTVQEVSSVTAMNGNLLDRRNLHIVRLLPEGFEKNSLSEIEIEDVVDDAEKILDKIVEIILRNGVIALSDFEDPVITYRVIRKAFRRLYTGQKQVFVFGCNRPADQSLKSLADDGIATIFNDPIDDLFVEDDEDYVYDEEEEPYIQLYANSIKSGQTVKVDKRDLIETDSFAKVLNVSDLNSVRIPDGMYQDYFYSFLKNSVREPQWYGYQYGFNIKRGYEDELYQKAKKGLENVGRSNNKMLLLVGQTGSGKSIALANLAYTIFNEKKYPVVFISNPEVDFRRKTRDTSNFDALDRLVKLLEEKGARSTLVIWDTSSFTSARERIYSLYQSLLSRGRKVFLIASAYETHKSISIEEVDDNIPDSVEANVLKNKVLECHARIEMSDETEQLEAILAERCKMNPDQIKDILGYYKKKNNANFLSLFYQVFATIRDELSSGVNREAMKNVAEVERIVSTEFEKEESENVFAVAFKKIEAELKEVGLVVSSEGQTNNNKETNQRVEEFIRCIAICSQFKLKMPYDFALRILNTYNPSIIRALTRSTFFLIDQDQRDDYYISIRTPLEAGMYIRANQMGVSEEIDCIEKLIENVSTKSIYGHNSEVRLCERLLIVIGPNNPLNRSRYRVGYDRLINCLENLRKKQGVWEPSLVSQEITYIREHYGREQSLDTETRVKWLQKAIRIVDELFDIVSINDMSKGIRNAITVECANSKILVSELSEQPDKRLYKELERDLKTIIRMDSQNTHAYVTFLKGVISEYHKETDATEKIRILEEMCSVVDEIMLDNEDIADSSYFQEKVTEIYSLLDDTSILADYIDELRENGSAAGIYLLAKKKLHENEVDFKKEIVSSKQYEACEFVYELFKDDKNKALVMDSEPCQYMLLNIVWLINNGKPIYSRDEKWFTSMREKAWREILSICNNYIDRFASHTEEVFRTERSIRYIKALCQAELGDYRECLKTIKSIGEDSTLGIARTYTKHIICDENGIPRKFKGRLGRYDETQRNGVVTIEEFGINPIYYFGPNLDTTNLQEGTVLDDLEVGINNIGPRVFRNLEKRAE